MGAAIAVRVLRSSGRLALLALAVVLPFEASQPIARLGPLQLSSVELFLYLALAAWGASLVTDFMMGDRDLIRRLRRWPAAHRAVVALALVMFVSAAAAPAARASALKFALRSAGGMLLYAAAADLLRAPGAAARTAKALGAGALGAAALAIAEWRGAPVASLLRPFHDRTFEALGLPRAGGPFQYPNIAAMYLEAVAPVAVGLGLATIAARRRAALPGVGAATTTTALVAIALLLGIVATASRAGLAGGGLAVLAESVLAWRAGEARAARAAIVALLIVGLIAAATPLSRRFRVLDERDWYHARVRPGATGRLPPVLAPSAEAVETLELQNLGALPWQSHPPARVALAYHWLDAATGQVVLFDGLRTPLPDDVGPGGRVTVQATVRAPSAPGRYILWWDLVHEHAVWFSERGNLGLRETVDVRGPAAPGPVALPAAGPPAVSSDGTPTSRRELWRAAWAAFRDRPLLGLGPDNFRHLYGRYLGLPSADARMHANSLYFETLADLGLLGVLAMAALAVAFGRAVRTALAAAGVSGRLVVWGLSLGLGVYFLHGAVDYFLEFTPTYGLFWLLAGALVALARPAPADAPLPDPKGQP